MSFGMLKVGPEAIANFPKGVLEVSPNSILPEPIPSEATELLGPSNHFHEQVARHSSVNIATSDQCNNSLEKSSFHCANAVVLSPYPPILVS